jgi:hypothetical protein
LAICAFWKFFSCTSGRLGACHEGCRDQRRYNIYSVNAHTARIGHPLNLPQGAHMPVSSAIIADGEMYTDGQGMKAHLEPIAMSRDDIISTQKEFVMVATLVAISKGKVRIRLSPFSVFNDMPLYDAAHVESDLATGKGDLIAVGWLFLANPDLPKRWQANVLLNSANMNTVY